MSKKLFKKLSITAFAVMMTVGVLLGGVVTPVSATSGRDLPDPNKECSVTVHKYSAVAPSSQAGNGLELSEAEAAALGKPLPGATFTLSYITDQGAVTSATDPATVATNAAVDPDGTGGPLTGNVVTDANGLATWGGLDQGYYVLKEISTPGAGYPTVSAPTIITLPMGITEDGTGFNYDVHVYPKNVSNSKLTKTTNNNDYYEEGDTVSWKIDAALNTGTGWLSYVNSSSVTEYGEVTINDLLDPRLSYTAKSAKLTALGGAAGPVALTVDTDYTETIIPPTAPETRTTIEWKLNDSGMKKLVDAKATSVRVDIDTVLKDVTDADSGVIKNGASFLQVPADPLITVPPTVTIEPGIEPEIKLAGIEIQKVDSKDTTLKLDGAKFKVADSAANAAAGKFLTNLGNYKTTAELTTGETHVEVTTGDNPGTTDIIEKGWGYVTGLPKPTDAAKDYYLVETAVPTNPNAATDGGLHYIMKQEPVKVSLPTEGNGMATVANQLEGNPPITGEKPTFVLPTTGGMGTILFTVAGLALMVGAVILIRRNKKVNA